MSSSFEATTSESVSRCPPEGIRLPVKRRKLEGIEGSYSKKPRRVHHGHHKHKHRHHRRHHHKQSKRNGDQSTHGSIDTEIEDKQHEMEDNEVMEMQDGCSNEDEDSVNERGSSENINMIYLKRREPAMEHRKILGYEILEISFLSNTFTVNIPKFIARANKRKQKQQEAREKDREKLTLLLTQGRAKGQQFRGKKKLTHPKPIIVENRRSRSPPLPITTVVENRRRESPLRIITPPIIVENRRVIVKEKEISGNNINKNGIKESGGKEIFNRPKELSSKNITNSRPKMTITMRTEGGESEESSEEYLDQIVSPSKPLTTRTRKCIKRDIVVESEEVSESEKSVSASSAPDNQPKPQIPPHIRRYTEITLFLRAQTFKYTSHRPFLISGTKKGKLEVRNLLLQLMLTLGGHKEGITCIYQCKEHSHRVVSGDEGGVIKIWHLRVGRGLKRTLRSKAGGIGGGITGIMEVPPHGTLLSSIYRCLSLWNPWTGDCIREIRVLGEVRSISSYNGGGPLLWVEGASYQVWDLHTGRGGSLSNSSKRRQTSSSTFRSNLVGVSKGFLALKQDGKQLRDKEALSADLLTYIPPECSKHSIDHPEHNWKVTHLPLNSPHIPRIFTGICGVGGSSILFGTWEGEACVWDWKSNRLRGTVQVTPKIREGGESVYIDNVVGVRGIPAAFLIYDGHIVLLNVIDMTLTPLSAHGVSANLVLLP